MCKANIYFSEEIVVRRSENPFSVTSLQSEIHNLLLRSRTLAVIERVLIKSNVLRVHDSIARLHCVLAVDTSCYRRMNQIHNLLRYEIKTIYFKKKTLKI